MRIEVNSAADFLMNLLRVRKANQLSESQLQHFKGSLEQILTRHFQRHWYPDVPNKGSAYRCLRINGKMDPIIEKAGHAVGLNTVILRKLLPLELTIWIDPDEVSYRIGENGTICVLYDTAQSRASPSSDLDSTGSSACDEFIMDRVGRLDLSVSSVDSGNGGSANGGVVLMADYMEHNSTGSGKAHGQQQQQQHHNNKYNHNQSSNNNHHNNHHHYAKQRHSNSMSSSSSGQTSPPLSPPYGSAAAAGYLNHQQQTLARYHNQQQHQQHQQQQHGNNFYASAAVHQPQQYFPWDNQFVNNKVRTQC
ncbi:protein Tob1 [Anopheles ziemanni]|uniref:protein Tob1 n=1 Tax=Anopheles coustani TaxID=139045 RepID=UPI00265AEC50|nr:protein Tob1 [Anopheles coustani]XP_058166972.1 protein Tob1 [Anopheles ziemanni]